MCQHHKSSITVIVQTIIMNKYTITDITIPNEEKEIAITHAILIIEDYVYTFSKEADRLYLRQLPHETAGT